MCAHICKILCTKNVGGAIWSQREFILCEDNALILTGTSSKISIPDCERLEQITTWIDH